MSFVNRLRSELAQEKNATSSLQLQAGWSSGIVSNAHALLCWPKISVVAVKTIKSPQIPQESYSRDKTLSRRLC